MSHHVTSLFKTLLQFHIPLTVKSRVRRVPLPTFLSDFITYSHPLLNLLQPHSLPDIPGTHQAESHPGAFALAASSGWKALLSDSHMLPPSSLSYLYSNASFSGRLYLIITLTQNAPPHSPLAHILCISLPCFNSQYLTFSSVYCLSSPSGK